MLNKRTLVKEQVKTFIEYVFDLYQSVDNNLIIDDKKINLSNKKICEVSLRKNPNFYFKFYKAIGNYRERLKALLSGDNDRFLLFESDESAAGVFAGLYSECRIKNINSIFSKVYQYRKKNEKGEVPIKKCLNDLFGFRVELSFFKLSSIQKLLLELKNENSWNFKIIDASKKKKKYRGIHLYITTDNYSFPWEIQFWLSRQDSSNRKSHFLYKQSYTSWEKEYGSGTLFEVRKHGTI